MSPLLKYVAATLLLAAAAHSGRAATLSVVTTTEDLAAITREVGGDRVSVVAIAKGYQNPHYVEPKPSFLLTMRKADLVVAIGRELEIAWLPPLLDQSRNPRIRPGGDGYLDASAGAEILEIPRGAVSRAMGDVHPQGNPHYWLDPENGRRMARSIAERLARLDAAGAPGYRTRLADFEKRLDVAMQRWNARMAPFRGTRIVTYHNSWPNFLKRFGLEVVGFVEPKPGVPPSPSHTLKLIETMKAEKIRLILVEPYFDRKTPDAVAARAGATVVVLYPSVGGIPRIKTYFDLFDHDLDLLVAALR